MGTLTHDLALDSGEGMGLLQHSQWHQGGVRSLLQVPSMLLLQKCAAAKDSLSSGLLWVKKTLGGSAGLLTAKLLSHCNGSCQHSLIAGTISTVWVSSKMEHSIGVLPQQLGWYGSTCSLQSCLQASGCQDLPIRIQDF